MILQQDFGVCLQPLLSFDAHSLIIMAKQDDTPRSLRLSLVGRYSTSDKNINKEGEHHLDLIHPY
jgi:hypothetical protein